MNRQEPVALLKQYSPTFALQLLIKHLIKQFSVIPLIKCRCFDTATPITTFIGSPCLQRGLSDQNKGKLEAEVSRRWWLLKWTASRKSDRESWRLFSIQLWVLRSRLFLLIWQWFGGGAWLLLPVEPSSSQNSSSSSRPARTGWHPLVWELPVASPRWCGSRCVAYSWRSFARTHKAGRPPGHAAWCGYACRRAVPSRYGWDDAATTARAHSGHGDVNWVPPHRWGCWWPSWPWSTSGRCLQENTVHDFKSLQMSASMNNAIIGSGNGLSAGWHQAITWTKVGYLSPGP